MITAVDRKNLGRDRHQIGDIHSIDHALCGVLQHRVKLCNALPHYAKLVKKNRYI
jgi:hypothetical protein